jgi:hypothetical protein
MSFGVFYTCFKEEDAVGYSVFVLKNYYPDCPIYLVSDGGSDYSFLENQFKTSKDFILSNRSLIYSFIII